MNRRALARAALLCVIGSFVAFTFLPTAPGPLSAGAAWLREHWRGRRAPPENSLPLLRAAVAADEARAAEAKAALGEAVGGGLDADTVRAKEEAARRWEEITLKGLDRLKAAEREREESLIAARERQVAEGEVPPEVAERQALAGRLDAELAAADAEVRAARAEVSEAYRLMVRSKDRRSLRHEFEKHRSDYYAAKERVHHADRRREAVARRFRDAGLPSPQVF